MCGIFGILINPISDFPVKNIEATLRRISQLSESRGKDSSGIAFRNLGSKTIEVIKGDVPIHKLLKSKTFEQKLNKSLESYQNGNGFTAFGHARLVTNGSQLQEVNNQPVIKNGLLLIHNGIIVNVDEIWQQNTDLKREFLIDTEIILSLLRKELIKEDDLVKASSNAFSQLEGTFSVACMFEDLDQFVLATNNGSLYYLTDHTQYIVFASERIFLKKLQEDNSFQIFDKESEIRQLEANEGLIINITTLDLRPFNLLSKDHEILQSKVPTAFQTNKFLIDNLHSKNEVVIDPAYFIIRSKEKHLFGLLENN
ncbi:MAG: hypothetical protein HXX14_11520 [Bacteroidetes bacterium]|nr:hypothetical protein [Bacteroidota bacterium]